MVGEPVHLTVAGSREEAERWELVYVLCAHICVCLCLQRKRQRGRSTCVKNVSDAHAPRVRAACFPA